MNPPLHFITLFLLVISVLTTPTFAHTRSSYLAPNNSELAKIFASPTFANPTNGSWWYVQVLSTYRAAHDSFESHQRQLVECSRPTFYRSATLGRWDLNHPPTAVGGIPSQRGFLSCRRDLNYPPTPVGGILSCLKTRKPKKAGQDFLDQEFPIFTNLSALPFHNLL